MWHVLGAFLLVLSSEKLEEECWSPAKVALEGIGTMWTGMQLDGTYVGCVRVEDKWGMMQAGEERLARSAERAGCPAAEPARDEYVNVRGCVILCARFTCHPGEKDPPDVVISGEELLATLLAGTRRNHELVETHDFTEVKHLDGEEVKAEWDFPTKLEEEIRVASTGDVYLLDWPEEETAPTVPPVQEVAEIPHEAESVSVVSQVEPEAVPTPEPAVASQPVAEPTPVVTIPAASPELAAFQREVRAAIDDLRHSRDDLRDRRDDLRERSRELRDDLLRKRKGLRDRSREIQAASP